MAKWKWIFEFCFVFQFCVNFCANLNLRHSIWAAINGRFLSHTHTTHRGIVSISCYGFTMESIVYCFLVCCCCHFHCGFRGRTDYRCSIRCKRNNHLIFFLRQRSRITKQQQQHRCVRCVCVWQQIVTISLRFIIHSVKGGAIDQKRNNLMFQFITHFVDWCDVIWLTVMGDGTCKFSCSQLIAVNVHGGMRVFTWREKKSNKFNYYIGNERRRQRLRLELNVDQEWEKKISFLLGSHSININDSFIRVCVCSCFVSHRRRQEQIACKRQQRHTQHNLFMDYYGVLHVFCAKTHSKLCYISLVYSPADQICP